MPTIRQLRARVEAIRAGEVEKALPRLALDVAAREAVEALTRSIVNKILHAPLARLREEAEREEGIAHLETTRLLFALDDAEPGAPDPGASANGGDPETA